MSWPTATSSRFASASETRQVSDVIGRRIEDRSDSGREPGDSGRGRSDGSAHGWLVRDARVLASIEIPTTRRARAVGLLGRSGINGAMLLRPARGVHSLGMRFDLDIAFLDVDGVVVRTLRLHRNRITPPVWRARSIIEAEAGAFGRWELKIGDVVEIRE